MTLLADVQSVGRIWNDFPPYVHTSSTFALKLYYEEVLCIVSTSKDARARRISSPHGLEEPQTDDVAPLRGNSAGW